MRERGRLECRPDDRVRPFGSSLALVRRVVGRTGAAQSFDTANLIPIVPSGSVATASIIVWRDSGRQRLAPPIGLDALATDKPRSFRISGRSEVDYRYANQLD